MRARLASFFLALPLLLAPPAFARLPAPLLSDPCPGLVGTTLDERNLRNVQVADLGFQATPDLLPKPLRDRWNSILRFDGADCPRKTMGSMTLIKRDEQYAYFLTVDHLLRDQDNPRDPGGAALCLQRALLKATKGGALLKLPIDRVDGASAPGTKKMDLALLRVKLEGKDAAPLRAMNVANIPRKCREPGLWEKYVKGPRFYALGYPQISDREEAFDPADGYDKRWSTGVAVEDAAGAFRQQAEKDNYQGHVYQTSNVDTLLGSSGSSQYYEDGEFAGVVAMSSAGTLIQRATRRVGNAELEVNVRKVAPGEAIHNAFVSCEHVVEFLKGTPADPAAR